LLALWEGLRRGLSQARALEDQLADVLGPLEPGEATSLALISGFSEELFFRGAVQGALGFTFALVVFTLLHTGPGRPFRLWTAFAALAGAALGGLMLWRGNLLGPVAAHALVNGVNLRRLARHGVERTAARREHESAVLDEGDASPDTSPNTSPNTPPNASPNEVPAGPPDGAGEGPDPQE
jgi:Type II CAAX prenyl endopeptidase Rce1-like